jgi:hypothetical protein
VRAEWDVEDVQVRAEAHDRRRRLLVGWRDRTPLRNRLLRIWKLPDKALVGEHEVTDGVEQGLFDFDHATLPDAKYRLEFTLRDDRSPPVAPGSFARNIQDIELRGAEAELFNSQRQQFDDFLDAIGKSKTPSSQIIETHFHPQIASLFLEHVEGSRLFCRAVYLRWRDRPRDRTTEEWQHDCLSLVGQVFSQAEVEHARLLEAMADAALCEGEPTGSDDLVAWWLQVLVEQGILQQSWGTSFATLLKRNLAGPLDWTAGLAPADALLQEVYPAVTWSGPDIAAMFLEKLRRTARNLECNSRPVTRIELKLSQEWPLVVHYRAKPQRGVPPGSGLSDIGRLFLDTTAWHRVGPQRWTDAASRFVLARFQRGLAWAAMSCSEQRHNQIHDLGRLFCTSFGQDYLSELWHAEQDLRKWMRASQREMHHES